MNWREEINVLGPRLLRYFAASFNRETAADLTQETLVRLVRKHQSGAFDPRAGSLAMYAYGIARMVRLEAWKESSRFGLEVPLDDEKQPIIGETSSTALLRNSIAELGDPQREILLLYIDEELTFAEIATLLDIPLNTVKSHVLRAKLLLKEKMRGGN